MNQFLNQFFTDLFTLGLMASIMAMMALGIRTCFRRMPKSYTYILWIFVFIRAVLPSTYSSAFSLWALFRKSPAKIPPYPSVRTAEPLFLPFSGAHSVQSLPQGASPAALDALERTAPDPAAAAAAIWAIGCLAMLLYSLATLAKLRQTVRFSVLDHAYTKKYGFSVYKSDQIKTAFTLGFFRPSVYLPAQLSEPQKRLILEHESTHIRRHDHQIKLAAWLILSLHWFQPMLWISFYFLDKDMELSCDERVLKALGTQIRADYSSLLLKFATQENFPGHISASFCSGGSKTRIKNVMRYRPQKTCSAALAFLLISITLYGCMGGPKEQTPETDPGAVQTEAGLAETPSEASDIPESEEFAFAKKFVSAIAEASTNVTADDIYEMLSPELKAEADSHFSYYISRLDTGHYMSGYGPFIPGEPVVTAESDNTFQYQMTPVSTNPDSYRWGNEDYIWQGKILVKRNTDGSLEVADWDNRTCEMLTSYAKYMENFHSDSTLQLIAETIPSLDGWKEMYPDGNAEETYYDHFGDPSAYLENSLCLAGGEVTDVKTDDATQDKQITYTWKDGSVVFHMQYRKQDNIWVPFKSTPQKL